MGQELVKIIEELTETIDEMNLKVDDSTLFDCAIRILNTGKIQQNKEKNIGAINKQDKKQVLATEKQINLLKKWKVITPKDLTKQEASKVINERINKPKDY
jgi:hypothetical protein